MYLEPMLKVSFNSDMNNPVKTRLHLSSKCHPGVLEDNLVPVTLEVDTNLILNVFKTYAETFIQF